jgi:hypothetical protein
MTQLSKEQARDLPVQDQIPAAQHELFRLWKLWEQADANMQSLLVQRWGREAGNMRYLKSGYDTPELKEASAYFHRCANAYHAQLKIVRGE